MDHQDANHRRARRPLERASRKRAGDPPEPADAPFALDRMAVLSHELGNLLDGSIRCLGLARRALSMGDPPMPAPQRPPTPEVACAKRQIETVYAALLRMADLVTAAMKGSCSLVGSPAVSPAEPILLEEAIRHAAEVMTSRADELRTSIAVKIGEGLGEVAAGPLYTVVLNALRNALDSICAAGGRGVIEVDAELLPPPSPPADPPGQQAHVLLEVRDDGRGLTRRSLAHAFEFGYSTRPGGLGVGLALSHELIAELGGTIRLVAREDRRGHARPGAILRVLYPARERGAGEGRP